MALSPASPGSRKRKQKQMLRAEKLGVPTSTISDVHAQAMDFM